MSLDNIINKEVKSNSNELNESFVIKVNDEEFEKVFLSPAYKNDSDFEDEDFDEDFDDEDELDDDLEDEEEFKEKSLDDEELENEFYEEDFDFEEEDEDELNDDESL